jgi:predicted phage terminase large subunit-like protein
LPPEARQQLQAYLEKVRKSRSWRCEAAACDGLPHTGYPYKHARWDQRPPDWTATPTHYISGGRGSGKTYPGARELAEWIVEYGGIDEDGEQRQWGVIAPTYGDGKTVCIEGGSGLLRALGLPPRYRGWNRGDGELYLPNGGVVFVTGADQGAPRIQGKNLSGAWCDEIGLWARGARSRKRSDTPPWKVAWAESLGFALRKDPSRIVATGTPKRGHPLVKQLLADPKVHSVRLRTLDNAANLNEERLAELLDQYAGTTLGRQELEGIFSDDVVGALWKAADIEDQRVDQAPALTTIVVAIDPAVTSGEDSDETGIVVAGIASDGEVYILADLSLKASPQQWMRAAIDGHDLHEADRMVAEVNNGGDLIETMLRAQAGERIAYRKVTATRGKQLRAEPVAALYEQGRVHHVGVFERLEEQMLTWTPEDPSSPDRLDAVVWAVTDLALGTRAGKLKVRRTRQPQDPYPFLRREAG